MYQSILVPLDGSTFGEQALPLAMSIARRSGAALELTHVHKLLDVFYVEVQALGDALEESLRKQEKAYLESVAQRLRADGSVKVTTSLLEGPVAAQIRNQAVETKADLVVITTHARGALGRFWLGSTADELIRELPMPVLMVHPTDSTRSSQNHLAFKKILIPLDGTPLAEQILLPAVGLAKLFGAEIDLLRVLQPLLPTSVPVGMGTFSEVALHMAEDVDKLQKQLEQGAFDYLEGVAKKLRAEKLTVKCHVVLADQPGVGVLKEAQTAGSDLIALETHGKRGLTRLFLGSVADKVIRGSPVPVLMHRPKH
jgi:nucleotide-binding universal stress UspA family protein